MTKKIILLFLFSLIVSCKNTPSSSSSTARKVTLPFDARPFSVNNISSSGSSLRKKLLHEIYLTQKALPKEDTNRILGTDLEDIKDDENYNNNFSKLIISYDDREELFYIPDGIEKEAIASALSLKLERNKAWVWKSELKKKQTAYLIEVSASDVLENEKLFSTGTTSSLDTIYPYQEIQISLEVYMAVPTYTVVSSDVKDPRCHDREAPEVCYCQYSRTVPTGAYTSLSRLAKNSLEGVLISDQGQQGISFHDVSGILKTDLHADSNQTGAKNFRIVLPANEGFQFISSPSNCRQFKIIDNAYNLLNSFQYKMEFKVIGVSETLESFGVLPSKI